MRLSGARFLLSQKIAHALTRALIALLIFTHASLALSSAISPSHDPLRSITHAHSHVAAQTEPHDHGHRHDVLDEEETRHQHGHNPADHSHEKPNVPPSHALGITPLANQWAAIERHLVYPAPCACLERPPKALPSI